VYLGSGVMSSTKILESKTFKNPSVWTERLIYISHNSSAGIFAFLHIVGAHRGQFSVVPFVIFVIKSLAKAHVGCDKMNLITNRCLSPLLSILHPIYIYIPLS
jgi:hypothetical protein